MPIGKYRFKDPLYGVAKDIEANGVGYVKSKVTLNRLLEINPKFTYQYDPEDGLYLVRYPK